MARTRTLIQMRDEIRNRGDLRSVRHTDAMLTRNINQSIADLYNLVVEFNSDYYLDSELISIVSGTANYSLASDFYKLVGVDILDINGNWINVRKFNFAERNQLQETDSSRRNVRYRIMGSNIRLRPTPAWSLTNGMQVWYVPVPAELSGDADIFDGISGWEEYIILDCIVKARVRDEDDPVGAQDHLVVEGQVVELVGHTHQLVDLALHVLIVVVVLSGLHRGHQARRLRDDELGPEVRGSVHQVEGPLLELGEERLQHYRGVLHNVGYHR